MNMSTPSIRFLTVLLSCLSLPVAPDARAQLPPFWEETSQVTCALPSNIRAVLTNRPDGGGTPLTQAHRIGGAVVDATITLQLNDAGFVPVPDFPAEDMWLQTHPVGEGNFVACRGGTVADGPTAADGIARWTAALHAGGWTAGNTTVVVLGTYLGPPIMLGHNSADLSGDLVVDLTDVGMFATDYFGPYSMRSDLRYDGAVNLSDLADMASAIGARCP